MKKYLEVSRLTLESQLVYRVNFFFWRFRSLVYFLTLFFFWLAIFENRTDFLGYQKGQILTYVVGIAFLKALIVDTLTAEVAGKIRSGELTKIVIAPVNFFHYHFFRDLSTKILNVSFVILEIGLILFIFSFPFYFPQNLSTYLIFGVSLFFSLLLHFFLSLSLSISAFWTDDPWAARWLFGVIFLEFFAGAFFPLDVLPAWLSRVIYFTPFPYLVFFPLKIWLEQVNFGRSVEVLGITVFWLIIFFILARLLWQKGSKNYGAFGG